MAEPGQQGLCVKLRQDGPIPLDLSLSCGANEIVALVGPSGSGKTTILRSIAGLYRPLHGRIEHDGDCWLDTASGQYWPAQRRRVGFVFQDYALFPNLTASGNVEAALGHLPRAERAARAMALLDQVNMGGLGARWPEQLSGGQCQRTAVARALARDPTILLLDEPFSAVDQVTRRRLQSELLVLHRSIAAPVIFVTHDLREAANIANRMAVLHRGSILQVGPPPEIFAHPASPTVTRLLDLPNLFEAVVRGTSKNGQITILDWCGQLIEAKANGVATAGDKVHWMVPQSSVILHRRRRPSRGERENPVSGSVVDTLTFGDQTTILLRPDCAPELPLTFSMSTHAARRNGIEQGVDATVSLVTDDIHIMAPG